MLVKHQSQLHPYGLTQPRSRRKLQVFSRPAPQKIDRPVSSTLSCRSNSSRKGISLSKDHIKDFDRLYGEDVWKPEGSDKDWCKQFFRKSPSPTSPTQRKNFSQQKQTPFKDVTIRLNNRIVRKQTKQNPQNMAHSEVRAYFAGRQHHCQDAINQYRLSNQQWNAEQTSPRLLQRSQSLKSTWMGSIANQPNNSSWSTQETEKGQAGFQSIEEYFRGSLIEQLQHFKEPKRSSLKMG